MQCNSLQLRSVGFNHGFNFRGTNTPKIRYVSRTAFSYNAARKNVEHEKTGSRHFWAILPYVTARHRQEKRGDETRKVVIAHGCVEFPLHENELDQYLRSA